MRVLVVYESMFGNTRAVAHAVGAGLSGRHQVDLWCAGERRTPHPEEFALVVVGGPTHAWGMSRPSTRAAAAKQAVNPEQPLELEPTAVGPGLREWLADADLGGVSVAAFDTRMAMPIAVTGSAARSIERALRRRGGRVAARRRSFLVSKRNVLIDGQLDLATAWGEELSRTIAPSTQAVG